MIDLWKYITSVTVAIMGILNKQYKICVTEGFYCGCYFV